MHVAAFAIRAHIRAYPQDSGPVKAILDAMEDSPEVPAANLSALERDFGYGAGALAGMESDKCPTCNRTLAHATSKRDDSLTPRIDPREGYALTAGMADLHRAAMNDTRRNIDADFDRADIREPWGESGW